MEDKLLAVPPIQEPPKKLPPVDLFLGLKDHGLQDQKFEIKIVQAFEVPVGNLFGMQVKTSDHHSSIVHLLMVYVSRSQQQFFKGNSKLARHAELALCNRMNHQNGKRILLSTHGCRTFLETRNSALPSMVCGLTP